MGANIPLPALNVQPPAPVVDPITRLGQMRQFANMALDAQIKGTQLAANQQTLQANTRKLAGDEAIRKAFVANQGDIDKTIADVSKNPNVPPDALQALQLHSQNLRAAHATATSEELKLRGTQLDNLKGAFQPIYDLPANTPPAQIEQAYQTQRARVLKSPQAFGITDPSTIPDTFPGKQQGELWMASMTGASARTEQALNAAKTREASGKGEESEAQAANLRSGLPTIQAQAGIAPQMAALDVQGKQAGIAETQARTAQTRMQTAQMANLPAGLQGVDKTLRGPASAAAEKAGNEYLTAKQAADNLSDFLDEARSGNKTAIKIVPLQGALEITTAQGVHRINRTEVDQYGGGGDAYDKVAGMVGGILTGKDISDSVLNSMDAMQQKIAQNSKQLYSDKLTTANQTYGSKFTPNFGTQRKASGPPTGATHIVPGPDGKNHYTNAGGTVDYGVAP